MNRLSKEQSLYLKQHAENPVDWYPWGEEAFSVAARDDKPILVSIGYSSCHWCHVMAHESFEDDYIAKLMNEHYVCVKVDREEHPEVDKYYMESVQMMNGQGGWPLNVFCLSDGRPFAGGTYFPPDESRGHQIVPWPQLLMRVADFYKRQKSDLEENAEAILGNLQASNEPLQATGDALTTSDLFPALQQILENRDKNYGGFGKAPKFPPCMSLNFLLTMRSSATVDLMNPDLCNEIDECIDMTLTAMAHGGIYDQLGGGFSRYSVDQLWLIPHFEKMLYDNALLIEIYSKAYLRYRKPIFKKVVEETISWLQREMKGDINAYYSAIDADSEEGEGDYYIWSQEQVKEVLGEEEAVRFCHVYGVSEEGNFEDSGRSQLALLEADPEVRDSLQEARQKLLAVRQERTKPGTDTKLILSWNALLMKAMATAGYAFGREDWILESRAIGQWITEHMRRSDGSLYSVAYGNESKGEGTLDDYAYTAEACLALAAVIDLVEPHESKKWIQTAEELTGFILDNFSDSKATGFFYTQSNKESRIPQKKEWFDNSTPSGNSSLLHVLSEIYALTGEAKYSKAYNKLSIAYPGITSRAPAAVTHALTAATAEAIGIAVVKAKGTVSLSDLQSVLVEKPYRKVFLLSTDEDNQPEGYQLCVGTQCLEPTKDPATIAENL